MVFALAGDSTMTRFLVITYSIPVTHRCLFDGRGLLLNHFPEVFRSGNQNNTKYALKAKQPLFARWRVNRQEYIINALNISFQGSKPMSKLFLLLCIVIICATAALALVVAESPAVGSSAPEFALTTNEGNQAALKDFRGEWVVLYFYPKDFTGGCTLEAHNFQTDLSKYQALNAVILGVSVDTAESHKSFCAKEGLAFKLFPMRTRRCLRPTAR